jgi:hypothetical protein
MDSTAVLFLIALIVCLVVMNQWYKDLERLKKDNQELKDMLNKKNDE